MYFFTFDRQLQALSHYYYIIIIITIASVTSSTDMCIIIYIISMFATQKKPR